MQENRQKHVPYWAMSPTDALSAFKVVEGEGLTEAVVVKQRVAFGRNEIDDAPGFLTLRLILRQFSSPLIVILGIATATTFFLDEIFDAAIILLAIVVNAALGFYQENKAENAVAHLRSFITARTRVVRDGRESEIDAADVVVGDIVHLRLGSRVPADGRLLRVESLRVDESVLTGESLPVAKHSKVLAEDTALPERLNYVFGGTLVTEGGGLMVVTAVGMQTEFGKIADLVENTKREETPLARTLARFAWVITVVIALLVIVVFALGVSRGEPMGEMFLISIAVAVGAIPEALPIALTAVLAIGVERLARKRGIMRSLTAAETLGSTTVVITDKTGTLTEAKLALVDVLTTDELLSGTVGKRHTEAVRLSALHKDMLAIASLACDVVVENRDDEPEDWRVIGSPLEATIVKVASMHGVPYTPRTERGVTAVVPFGSAHKFSVHAGVITAPSGLTKRAGDGYAHIILGAPDILLERARLSKDEYLTLKSRLEAESEAGKRLIGLAITYLDKAEGTHTHYKPTDIREVEFLGTIAFFDPVRSEVPDALRKIEAYGVRVVMATGDLPGTAFAVARDLGWKLTSADILTGTALSKLDDAELRDALAYVRVFARVTPKDKLRIAKLYQSQGDVVAMTGDGVNDAPSLKAVDIGIAVGSGSDVAKSVADLILLDDNFNTIVAAIEEGKRVLRNIRKTFVYLVSNSLDEIMLIGGSLLAGLPLPLTAMQIIWVNFFTGSLPAIAFAFDDDDPAVTSKRADREILNGNVRYLTIVIALFTSSSLFLLYAILSQFTLPEDLVRSFVFACFASYILFVTYSLRDLKRPLWSYQPFTNKVLNTGVAFGITLLGLTLYVPWFQEVFSTQALPVFWLIGVVLWMIFSVAMIEAIKASYRLFATKQ